jgi:hypothetical protein
MRKSNSWLCVNDGLWATIKLAKGLMLEFEEGCIEDKIKMECCKN